jgi:hypothetical protein
MPTFFDPTPEEKRVLEALAAEIHDVQRTLVQNHDGLRGPDRAAHQQQLAGSVVRLTLNATLPGELDGLGIFQAVQPPGAHRVGIGRISTGLGCPHAETEADFLGLMVAFLTPAGRRVDFVCINDPTSPTDTPEEFLALLKATADSAGTSGLLASSARLLAGLTRHAGIRGPVIAAHVAGQTLRTVRSSSAYQQYWTGVVRARDVLGKFTFVPIDAPPPGHQTGRGEKHLTEDWRTRQSAGSLDFQLHWIPFLSERETPLKNLTDPWKEDHRVRVGTVTFPRTDPNAIGSKLTALLASELGANQGNWDETSEGPRPELPATRFTAARWLAYRTSQRGRDALPDDSYRSFFDSGEVGPELARTLVRRYHEKRAAGHWVPDVGDVSVA